jgi:hypothetical protein
MAEEPEERVHSKDKDFTLFLKVRGAFTLLSPVGRYSDSLLAVLASEFLSKPAHLALDLSRLDSVSLPLVRALREYASGLEAGAGKLVFVRPPDQIRALLKLVDREQRIALTLAETDLDGSAEESEERLRRGQERLRVVREMLSTHPCWQLVDPEGRWLCPFCATFRADVGFVARGVPAQSVVERVSKHLGSECSTYSEGATDGWPFEVLERVLTREDPPRPAARSAASSGPAEPGAAPPKPLDTRRRHLLPPAPVSLDGAETALHYHAAGAPTGAFYDFLRLGDGRWGVLVGDLSPHGVEPGVLMGLARKVLRIRMRECPDLATALGRANDDLCEELEQESYVTALAAAVDGPGRRVCWARAGHAAPFLFRAMQGTVERLETPGPLLGLVPTATFEEAIGSAELALEPGDFLLLHGEGLEGMRNLGGEAFGADRMAAVLSGQGGKPAAAVLEALLREAARFRGPAPQERDATAILLRFP